VGKPEGKETTRKKICERVDNIKMNLRKDAMICTGLICLRIRTGVRL
jgi:hypothetical protein